MWTPGHDLLGGGGGWWRRRAGVLEPSVTALGGPTQGADPSRWLPRCWLPARAAPEGVLDQGPGQGARPGRRLVGRWAWRPGGGGGGHHHHRWLPAGGGGRAGGGGHQCRPGVILVDRSGAGSPTRSRRGGSLPGAAPAADLGVTVIVRVTRSPCACWATPWWRCPCSCWRSTCSSSTSTTPTRDHRGDPPGGGGRRVGDGGDRAGLHRDRQGSAAPRRGLGSVLLGAVGAARLGPRRAGGPRRLLAADTEGFPVAGRAPSPAAAAGWEEVAEVPLRPAPR